MFPCLRWARSVRVVCALVLGVAMMPIPAPAAEALTERVTQILERRGLGAEALRVIDNLITHEGPPPPAAPDHVRALLKDPLAAVNVAALFDQLVPESLRRLADAAIAPPPHMPDADPLDVTELLTPYLNELSEARRLLRAAAKGHLDTAVLLKTLDSRSPSLDDLRAVMRTIDPGTLSQANKRFVEATARLVAALRARQGSLRFPAAAMRFESSIGAVVIGTRGDDAHGGDAALIIDPGGNDTYTRAPAAGGAVSVIIDLGGNDLYTGSDVAVHGLSAIVDLEGNDRYTTTGAGQGSALAGVSLILDFKGDDIYEAGFFAQGTAAFGLGAIVDVAGNDTYRLRTGGQGYGMAGGTGVLWDRAGNDTYVAAGLPDAFARGGGISAAQGAAYGYRTSLGGGIGILRDDAGDDSYMAEMFAQGMGYYYGIGLLWDRAGNDQYHAVRYAQGSGVHEAIGVLRDESGDDRYTATVGVSQGMGIDLAVGVLYDGAGDDIYRGDVLVQGAATSNGIGLLIDTGGADQWHAGTGWGDAEWARGLPTLGLLLNDPSRASYTQAGKPFSPVLDSDRLGGPLASLHRSAAILPVAPDAAPACPAVAADATDAKQESVSLAELLSRVMPGLAGGTLDAAAYVTARRRLATQLRASIAASPGDDFNTLWTAGRVIECAAHAATAQEVELMWTDIEYLLNTDRTSPFAGILGAVLRLRPPPVSRVRPMLQILAGHPACSVRAGALRLRGSTLTGSAGEEEARDQVAGDARAALEDACWRMQMAARDVLKKLGVPFDPRALPLFLREYDSAEPDERDRADR